MRTRSGLASTTIPLHGLRCARFTYSRDTVARYESSTVDAMSYIFFAPTLHYTRAYTVLLCLYSPFVSSIHYYYIPVRVSPSAAIVILHVPTDINSERYYCYRRRHYYYRYCTHAKPSSNGHLYKNMYVLSKKRENSTRYVQRSRLQVLGVLQSACNIV